MCRLFALLVFVCLALNAQTPDTATIHGQVLDQSHAGIPGVQVTARNILTNLERTAQTDASGKFTIAGLPVAGSYDVTAAKEGFAEARLNNTTVAGGTAAD